MDVSRDDLMKPLDKALDERGVDFELPCPLCGDEMRTEDGPVNLLTPTSSIPCGALICVRCGYVRLHSLFRLGLKADGSE